MRRTVTITGITAAMVWLVLGGSTAFARRAPAIPTTFHAQSTTWVSPEHGWMLGSAPCGADACATVIGTTDGGRTWNQVGALDAPVTFERRTGVTEIRFADDLHGWAFDPALWTTDDGGATWTKLATPGARPAVALAGDADGVYLVVSACRFGVPISNCLHRETLWRTRPGPATWTLVPLTLPVNNQAMLAVHGVVAYVVVPAALLDRSTSLPADALAVTTDGSTWSSRPDPCDITQGEFLAGIAPSSDTDVALLCQGNIGFGKAEKRVLRSTDNGQTTTSAGTMPIWGIMTQLAAAPDGTLVASSFSIGSWIYRNAGGTTWTTQADLGDGGMGWNDVQFVSNEAGFVIHGPSAVCCRGHSGELWTTRDGGLSWGPA